MRNPLSVEIVVSPTWFGPLFVVEDVPSCVDCGLS